MINKIFTICFLVILVSSSCKKQGCTNSLATNYDEKAKTNNGSCQFETRVSFWLNNTVSATLTNSYGVTDLNIFIDEHLVGTINPNDWSVGPDCNGENFTVTIDMEGNPIQTSKYVVNDQAGTSHFSGEIEFLPEKCHNIQMKW